MSVVSASLSYRWPQGRTESDESGYGLTDLGELVGERRAGQEA